MTDLNHTGNKTIYSSTFQYRQLIISFPYLISFTQQFIHTLTDKDTAYTHVFHNIIPSYPHTFHMQEFTHTYTHTHTHTHTCTYTYIELNVTIMAVFANIPKPILPSTAF